MKLSEIMSIEKLEKYVEDGFVSKRKHPTLPLYILNYTAATQFEFKFDEVTLNTRGLVIDEDYNVIARSFPKFFTYEQLIGREDLTERLNENVQVMDKVDGSLGLIFKYNGDIITATRGSFESEQAFKAAELVEKYYKNFIEEGFTYLTEIVYPENRVVLSYGSLEDLILLAVIDTMTGEVKVDEYKRISEDRNYLPDNIS